MKGLTGNPFLIELLQIRLISQLKAFQRNPGAIGDFLDDLYIVGGWSRHPPGDAD